MNREDVPGGLSEDHRSVVAGAGIGTGLHVLGKTGKSWKIQLLENL